MIDVEMSQYRPSGTADAARPLEGRAVEVGAVRILKVEMCPTASPAAVRKALFVLSSLPEFLVQ